jgi:hypothetical protein
LDAIMNRLAYLTVMALLGIGLTMAQSTKPNSDPSNSSNSSTQSQGSTSTTGDSEQAPARTPRHHRTADAQSNVPDTTVQDRQNSATSTTGVSGQNENQPSTSTMGTTGSSAAAPDSSQRGNTGATIPQNATPPDQQPNSTTDPHSPQPQAALTPGPEARAVATHTPDPGTCMSPNAVETAQSSAQTNAVAPCR